MQKLRKANWYFGRGLNVIGVSLLPIMSVLITTDVIGRKFFGAPVPGALELTEVMTVVVVCFGLAYAAALRQHICVDILTSHLCPRVKAAIASVVDLVALAVLGVLVYGAILDVAVTRDSRHATMVLAIPIYPFRLALALGFLALFLELVFQWFESLRQALNGGSSS